MYVFYFVLQADESIVTEVIWPQISEEITSSKELPTLILYHLASLCNQRFNSVIEADILRLFGAKHVINKSNIDDIARQLMVSCIYYHSVVTVLYLTGCIQTVLSGPFNYKISFL